MSIEMSEIPKWAWGCFAIAAIYFLASHPVVFATLLTWIVVAAAALFFIGGFVFYVKFNGFSPPWWVAVVFIVFCFIWPSLLGLVIGIGMVGGLTYVALLLLGYFED